MLSFCLQSFHSIFLMSVLLLSFCLSYQSFLWYVLLSVWLYFFLSVLSVSFFTHPSIVYLWAFCLSSPSLLSLVLLFLRFSLSPLLSHIDCCDRTTESSCEGTKHNITFLTFYWWYSIAGVDSRQELQYACRQTIGSHGPIKGRQQARTTGYL